MDFDRPNSTRLRKIAEKYGTPVYVYDQQSFTNAYTSLRKALPRSTKIRLAVKANSNLHVLAHFRRLGCGADIVSGGELFRALTSGIKPRDIVFSGVGKTPREIDEALRAGIGMFNVESVGELEVINGLAKVLGANAKVSLRLNPGIEAKTHPHLITGSLKSKFGLDGFELKNAYRLLPGLRHLDVSGLSCHVGSQIHDLQPLVLAWKKLLATAKAAPFDVRHLNLGGGLGVDYFNDRQKISVDQYGAAIEKIFGRTKYQLSVEPGRALTAMAGTLVTRLVQIKKRESKIFYVLDAGMTELIRPALYGATHPIAALEKHQGSLKKVCVVGPICETGDVFEESARLPSLEPGALLAIKGAGAYAMSMASQYNSRPRAPEVLVDGPKCKLIRSRETYADLVKNELV